MPKTALTAVTLGVNNVPASARFYEALGFTRKFRAAGDDIAFFEAGGVALVVCDWSKLAEDASLDDEPRSSAFSGMTLAWNCATRKEVDAALDKAFLAGAPMRRKPRKGVRGGYRGYFCDLDGYFWEVVKAPGLDLTKDGRLILPD